LSLLAPQLSLLTTFTFNQLWYFNSNFLFVFPCYCQ